MEFCTQSLLGDRLYVNQKRWKKFIRPEELNDFFKSNGLQTLNTIGVKYNILSDSWENTSNKAINYMMACRKK